MASDNSPALKLILSHQEMGKCVFSQTTILPSSPTPRGLVTFPNATNGFSTKRQDSHAIGVVSTTASAIGVERMRSTRRLPSSTINSKLREKRKSPTRTEAGLPQIKFAVRLKQRQARLH